MVKIFDIFITEHALERSPVQVESHHIGWGERAEKREKGAHWLIDVPTSECGDLPTLS